MISIIIPTYNQRGFLTNAINSALSQSYQDVEVIVVDDNNPDTEARIKTEQLMAAYADNPKVRYLKHEHNKNGSAARNTGFRASKGDFIAFLDDDDYFFQEKLTRQVDFLDKHPEFDAVYTSVKVDDKVCKTLPFEGNLLVPLLKERTRMFTSSLLFRRGSIECIGGFDESFRRHQDYELMIKFFVNGFKVGYIPEVLTGYNSIGGNRLQGKALEGLKEKYLNQFSSVIEDLDRERPGLKRSIVVNNYASVFFSHVASRQYRRAIAVFLKYFSLSPTAFISYLCFFAKMHLKK